MRASALSDDAEDAGAAPGAAVGRSVEEDDEADERVVAGIDAPPYALDGGPDRGAFARRAGACGERFELAKAIEGRHGVPRSTRRIRALRFREAAGGQVTAPKNEQPVECARRRVAVALGRRTAGDHGPKRFLLAGGEADWLKDLRFSALS
jgi:hypothetical protein